MSLKSNFPFRELCQIGKKKVGAVEIATFGLMSGFSGVNSVAVSSKLPNSVVADTGDRNSFESKC